MYTSQHDCDTWSNQASNTVLIICDCCQAKKKEKVKVWFYIALYPVRWTAQSALHSPPLADLFIPTPFSASLGSILAMQQLRNDYSLTFPPLSIARYSFIQLSRLRRREMKENAQTSKRYQRGFEPGLSRLRVRHSTNWATALRNYRPAWQLSADLINDVHDIVLNMLNDGYVRGPNKVLQSRWHTIYIIYKYVHRATICIVNILMFRNKQVISFILWHLFAISQYHPPKREREMGNAEPATRSTT